MYAETFFRAVNLITNCYRVNTDKLNQNKQAQAEFDALVGHRYIQGLKRDPKFSVDQAIEVVQQLIEAEVLGPAFDYDKSPEQCIASVLRQQRVPVPIADKAGLDLKQPSYVLAC